MANVTPTKSNLTALQEETTLAKEGHGLLEQKREVLVINLNSIVANIKEKRGLLDEKLSNVYHQLNLVRLESGGINLDLIVNSVAHDYEVEPIPHSIMGVVAPRLVYTEKKTTNRSKVPMGISGTSPNFDKLLQITIEIKSLITEVAYLESTAWRLVNEIKKTQRRINDLENFVIPEAVETIKFIKNILEEKDRETLFQIKRIKAKQEKKKALKKETAHDV